MLRFIAHPPFQHRLPALPWQLPISKDGRACWPCVWREALRGAGGAHMEQWPSGKKKEETPCLPVYASSAQFNPTVTF